LLRRLTAHPLTQLTLARVRELIREPEAIFWVFAFPVLLAVALGIAFRTRPPEALPIGVENGPQAEEVRATLAAEAGLTVQVVAAEEARRKLAAGRFALVVLIGRPGEPPTYWFDPTRPESRLARLAVDAALQRAAGRSDAFTPGVAELSETGSRYIDFLVPGLLGMNLMGTGIWAVGFALVQVCKARGAAVIAVGRSAKRLDRARSLGADATINAAEEKVAERIRALTGGEGADVVFELVGVRETMDASAAVLGKRGRLVFIGYSEDLFTVSPLRLVIDEAQILASVGNTLQEVHDAVAWAAAGKFQACVDRTVPLEEAPAALEALRRGEIVGRAVLIP